MYQLAHFTVLYYRGELCQLCRVIRIQPRTNMYIVDNGSVHTLGHVVPCPSEDIYASPCTPLSMAIAFVPPITTLPCLSSVVRILSSVSTAQSAVGQVRV
jgi:hypothetical protein